MKHIALYTRVSTDEQVDGYSLSAQKNRIYNYIKAFDNLFTEEIKEYTDDGFSGKNLHRNDITTMISLIKNNGISTVIIYKLDRLTRNLKDLIYLIELFDKYNIKLVSITENIDTSSPMGRFFIYIIVLIAQWERETIVERTIMAVDQAIRENEWISGNPPYGYSKNNRKQLVINKSEAKIITEIYDYFLIEEMSIRAISLIIKNKYRGDRKWSYSTIKDILENPIYKGVFIGKRITNDTFCKPIIDPSLFDEVQDRIINNNKNGTHRYMFRNKCYSQNNMRLEHTCTVKPTQVYIYYFLSQSNQRINEDLIVEQLDPFIDKYIFNTFSKRIKKYINRQLEEDKKERLLTRMYISALVDSDFYEEVLQGIKNKNNSFNAEINTIIKRFRSWDLMNKTEKKKFILSNVDKIIIDMNTKTISDVSFTDITEEIYG